MTEDKEKDGSTETREREGEAAELRAQIEQLRVQLAGCGVAAQGWAKGENDCEEGGYGWSPAFEEVKKLRAKYEAQLKHAEWMKQTNHQAHHEGPLEDCTRGTCLPWSEGATG